MIGPPTRRRIPRRGNEDHRTTQIDLDKIKDQEIPQTLASLHERNVGV
jgi:hypothetical protein